MSYPRISVSWETIGKLKQIADEHQCYRDDDDTMPCIGEMLFQIAEGDLVVIDAHQHTHFEQTERKYHALLRAPKPCQ